VRTHVAYATGFLIAVLVGGVMPGCARASTNNPAPAPTHHPATATPPIDGAAQLRSALVMEDRLMRREAVLLATGVYLNDDTIVGMDDESVSQALTELAFSTGRLVIPDPAFVRRAPGEPRLAVVGLPDAIGLALYDQRQPGTEPLLLTPWTAGLASVFVTWGQEEAGVNYLTVGKDGQTRAHFLLVIRGDDGQWRVTWFSDEVRNWWLNGLQGQLEVTSDLSRLTLVGQSDGTTIVFDEGESGVRRSFHTTWERQGPVYVLTPDPSEYPSHQEWLWAVAQPDPYATLVEFLERLRNEDVGGASRLATSSVQGLTAVQFDLDSPGRRYVVLDQTADGIIFGDEFGRYQMTFTPPARDGEKWLVGDVGPVEVEEEAAEP